jgi:hypothetical protein
MADNQTTQIPPSLDIPRFSAQEILTERWTAGVRQTANYLSIDFAMLGRIDIANRIQTLLQHRDYDYIPEGMYDGASNYWPFLNFAWEAARLQDPPMDEEEAVWEAAHIPGPDMEDEEALEKRQKEETAWVEQQCFENSPVRLDPQKYKRQCEVEQHLKRIFNEGVGEFDEDEVVATMTELSDMCAPGTFQGGAVRARAIDYMMEKGRQEQAAKMLDQVVEVFQKKDHKKILHYETPKLRYAWRLYATGMLRVKLGIDDKVLEEKGEEAIRTIEKRLRDGPSRPLALRSLNELIDMIKVNLRDDDYPDEWRTPPLDPKPSGRQPNIERKNFFPKPPATESEIAAVETRLGTELPEDFKAFLRLTNGFAEHNDLNRVDVVNGIDALSWEPPLIEEYALELSPGCEAAIHPDIEPVGLARVIPLNDRSSGIGDYVYLVEPCYVDEARVRLREYYENSAEPWLKRIMDLSVQNYFGGWEALEKVEWGVVRFTTYESYFEPSFRSYLEDLVRRSGKMSMY